MKTSIAALVVSLTLLSACSGAKLKTEWEEDRKYPETEVAAIMEQAEQYKKILISAQMSSNAFNSAPMTNAQARLRAIFCACAKKLGPKCRDRSGAAVDRDLWRKANAVDMAFVMNHTAVDIEAAYKVDPLECQ